MAASKPSDTVRDEVLEFVRKSEETITEASRRWTESLLRELVPGNGEGVRKVVDEAFDFTERILKNQRELASSVLDTLLGPPPPKRAPAKRASATKRAAAPKRAPRAKAKKPARATAARA